MGISLDTSLEKGPSSHYFGIQQTSCNIVPFISSSTHQTNIIGLIHNELHRVHSPQNTITPSLDRPKGTIYSFGQQNRLFLLKSRVLNLNYLLYCSPAQSSPPCQLFIMHIFLTYLNGSTFLMKDEPGL